MAESKQGTMRNVEVPDLGSFDKVGVIEIFVTPGQTVAEGESLIMLESDKATMDIPAPFAGTVREVKIEVGAKVAAGDLIAVLETGTAPAAAPEPPAEAKAEAMAEPTTETKAEPAPPARESPKVVSPPTPAPAAARAQAPALSGTSAMDRSFDDGDLSTAHAGPGVRRFARELGVDLEKVTGTGRKGRIVREDVQGFVKRALESGGSAPAAGSGIPPIPAVDFSRFGEIEIKELSRIRRISATHLHRSWVNVPHVTQHEDADVTDLESYRQAMNLGIKEGGVKEGGVKLTFLHFLVKAAVAALREYPDFNSSLTPDGSSLVHKKYFHIGFAADTPNGLLVPVVKNADRKSIPELAAEIADLAARARAGKLKPDEMQGGSFSISSLGGIGGTAFTPIVNAPEVAILGVSRSATKPVYQNGAFVPRLMLPLSLSYDHRVIDGAAAARFVVFLASLLGDVKRLVTA